MADDEAIRAEAALQTPVIQVNEPPKFDLDTHISNYDPPTRLARLIHIGLASLPLQRDALLLAQSYAKTTRNLPRYLAISSYLTTHFPSDPSVRPDESWISTVSAQTAAETQRLEAELKGYKNNLIKESIRMAQEELGNHFFATGQLVEAGRNYSKMRENCTTQAHLAYMHIRLALVAVAQQSFRDLSQCVTRIESQQAFTDYPKLAPAMRPLSGLCALTGGDYQSAAGHFLHSDPAFAAPMEPVASGILLNRAVLSPNDVATYGALCALASLNRTEIQSSILDSAAPFRQFLELEPHMRRALTAFAGGKYTQCLTTLSAYRADWLCDVYLHRHVDSLMTQIRRKCIVEYFKPFSAVTIQAMADAFGDGDADAMMAELIQLIGTHTLNARVDAVAGLLLKPATSSPRVAVAEKALKAADEQERTMRLRLWRTELLSCGMEVKSEKRLPHMPNMGSGMGGSGQDEDEWQKGRKG